MKTAFPDSSPNASISLSLIVIPCMRKTRAISPLTSSSFRLQRPARSNVVFMRSGERSGAVEVAEVEPANRSEMDCENAFDESQKA